MINTYSKKQEEEMMIFEKFYSILEEVGCFYMQEDDLNYINSVFENHNFDANKEENGNVPPDIIDKERNVGIEIFKVSTYSKMKNSKKNEQVFDVKLSNDVKDSVKQEEKKAIYKNGFHSYGDDTINSNIKHGNYDQNIKDYIDSVVLLIEKHYKTYKKVKLDKKGFLIVTDEPIGRPEISRNPIDDIFSIFNVEKIYNKIELLDIDFWFFMNGDNVVFHKKGNVIDFYPDDFKVLLHDQTIHINRKIIK